MQTKQQSLYSLINRLSAVVYANDVVRYAFGIVMVGLMLLIMLTDINNKWNLVPIGILLIYTHGIKKIYGKGELKR